MSLYFHVPRTNHAPSAGKLRKLLVSSAFVVAAAGCTGGHGFLGTDFNPKGGIIITNATTKAVLSTSASNPYRTTNGGFSVGMTETNFQGPYTVTITSWTNGTSKPCFVPHPVTATGGTSVELFSADNATSAPPPPPNPCIGGGQDIETAVISDGKGNSTTFYFTLSP